MELLLWAFGSLERLWWRYDDLQTKSYILQGNEPSPAQQWRMLLVRNKWNRSLVLEYLTQTLYKPIGFKMSKPVPCLTPLVELEYAARVGNVEVCQSLLQNPRCKLSINAPLYCQPDNPFPRHYRIIVYKFFDLRLTLTPIRSAVLFDQVEVMKVLLKAWTYASHSELEKLLRVAAIMGRFEIVKLLFPLVITAKGVLLGDLKHVISLQVLEWLIKEIRPNYNSETFFCDENLYYRFCYLNQDHLGECVCFHCRSDHCIPPFTIPVKPIPPAESMFQVVFKNIYYEIKKFSLSWGFFIEDRFVDKLSPHAATHMIQKFKLLARMYPESPEVKYGFSIFLMNIACGAGTLEHLELANKLFTLHNFPKDDLQEFLECALAHGHMNIVLAIMKYAKVMDTVQNNAETLGEILIKGFPLSYVVRGLLHIYRKMKDDREAIFIHWYNLCMDNSQWTKEYGDPVLIPEHPIMIRLAELLLKINKDSNRDDFFQLLPNGRLTPLSSLPRLMNTYRQLEGMMHRNFLKRFHDKSMSEAREGFSSQGGLAPTMASDEDYVYAANRIKWDKRFLRREEFLRDKEKATEDYECAICYGTLAELHEHPFSRLAIITECKHYYCISCIANQATCPLCTAPLNFPDDQWAIHAFPETTLTVDASQPVNE